MRQETSFGKVIIRTKEGVLHRGFSKSDLIADKVQLVGALRRSSGQNSVFGPPVRHAEEIFGHNTQAAHTLLRETALSGLTGGDELPNESAYCESCGQCLFAEWYYRMFRLTGEAACMDAVERARYNTVAGCADLDRPNFFYCNPQEQLPDSPRSHTSGPESKWEAHYTWQRQFTEKAACCHERTGRRDETEGDADQQHERAGNLRQADPR